MFTDDQLLKKVQADPRYLKNLDWGVPRDGHPEGSVRHHIADLENNLERLIPQLNSEETGKLRLLIHTHDTFKPDAKSGVAISDPRSHASLSRQFLAEFTDDTDLLNVVQLHDEPYALWRKHSSGGDPSQRLEQLLSTITDWDLFLAFLIIDGCTPGKSRESLHWFFQQIAGRVSSRVTRDWFLA